VSGRVVATEKEPTKAARAREHWAEAGDEVVGVIELREGDLLETLNRDDMPEQVDFLLLDSEFLCVFACVRLGLT
jgi:predicted O-methyltransferase YrrM